jgi:hypothetical protein
VALSVTTPTPRPGRSTVRDAAEEIRGYLAAGNRQTAMRVVWSLGGDLTGRRAGRLPELTSEPPASTGSERFDALLAAIVDYVLTDAGLPRPAWLNEPGRKLTVPWDVEPVPALWDAARAVTPAAIRRHGVFLDPDELINL